MLECLISSRRCKKGLECVCRGVKSLKHHPNLVRAKFRCEVISVRLVRKVEFVFGQFYGARGWTKPHIWQHCTCSCSYEFAACGAWPHLARHHTPPPESMEGTQVEFGEASEFPADARDTWTGHAKSAWRFWAWTKAALMVILVSSPGDSANAWFFWPPRVKKKQPPNVLKHPWNQNQTWEVCNGTLGWHEIRGTFPKFHGSQISPHLDLLLEQIGPTLPIRSGPTKRTDTILGISDHHSTEPIVVVSGLFAAIIIRAKRDSGTSAKNRDIPRAMEEKVILYHRYAVRCARCCW